MTDALMYYAIGYRDALAVLCAEARLGGAVTALRKAAEHLLQMDPDHCHAKVIIEQMKEQGKVDGQAGKDHS